MSSIVLKLEGLDCAHCAEKLQSRIEKISEIDEVSVNVINRQMDINYKNITEDSLIRQVREISKSLGVDIACNDRTEVKGKFYKNLDKLLKLKLLRYAVGLTIYATAILANFDYAIISSLYIASYIVFGADIILKALKSMLRLDFFNENFLLSIASIGAIYIGMHSEAVAVMIFFQIGEFFQDIAVNNARKSIKDLMDLKAEYANLIVDGDIKKVEPDKVGIGDIILVKSGEKVALDGVVIEGISQIDASALIGESVPRKVEVEDEIMSGVINLTGVIKVRVTSEYSDSTVSKIMNMVENASAKKANTERFITQFAKIYTPIVIAIALLLMFVAPILVPDIEANQWIYRGLVFLLVSCPCALHLSVPLSFFSGIGSSSRKGVLIKGSNYLQALNDVSIVVFDKTGTLTKGVFAVTNIYPKNNLSENNIMDIAGCIESLSNHPIAKSIVNECERRHIDISKSSIKDFEEIQGKGLKGNINGKEVLAGNNRLMESNNILYESYDGIGTVIHLAEDSIYLGFIVISDIIKEDSSTAIQKLKQQGIRRTVILSGDRKESVHKVADSLGIDEVHAELLPNEKVDIIEDLYSRYPNEKIAFVGDGINDAPVLSRVDVGIAMGGIGSDAAVEAADMVIMTDEISSLSTVLSISKRTMAIIRQNIFFVLSIKFLVLMLTVVGFGNMWLAILADTGATLVAVLNSVREKIKR